MSTCSELELVMNLDGGTEKHYTFGTFDKQRHFINGRTVYKNRIGEDYLFYGDGIWQVTHNRRGQ